VTEVVLEVPPSSEMGDYAFPCFALAKTFRKSPGVIAVELANTITEGGGNGLKPAWLARAVAQGPYINFFIDKGAAASAVLGRISAEKDEYGHSALGKGKTVVIDYSSPNIGKPMHIGHLCSTVLGHALYNAYKALGYKVVGVNHLGDWGTQFGVLIAAFKRWGDEKKLKEDPVNYLLSLYVRWHEEEEKDPAMHDEAKAWFKMLEDGDKEAHVLWQRFHDANLAYFKTMYNRLGIRFDSYNGEAFYNDKMAPVLLRMEQQELVEEDQGCLIVRMKDKNLAPLIARKSDEASTYALRDLAAIDYRFRTYEPFKVLYITGHEQALHFKQVFEVAGRLGMEAAALAHVNFGMMRLPEGKMSTRKGRMILLEALFDKAAEMVLAVIEEKNPDLKDKEKVAEQIGIGAVVFGYLMNDRVKDTEFSWERATDFTGDTGPYVQYTHARSCSVLRKAKKAGAGSEGNGAIKDDANYALLTHEKERQLIQILGTYPDEVMQVTNDNKPHVIAQYLLRLCHAYNEFYQQCTIMNAESPELIDSRLLLNDCARQVIKNGLSILGLAAPQEM
jgi:arginyl-tRNA synthetase